MGKTLTIRNIPEQVYERFAEVARKNRRSVEAHGRFLIERETEHEPLETCGEILEAITKMPPPNMEVEVIEARQASRSRRSGANYTLL